MFQSIAGTQRANEGFGINLELLREGYEATLALKRGTVGQNVMYFETGQGSALSSNAHHGVDQQTLEVRAYAVARKFNPLLGEYCGWLYWPRVFIQWQTNYPCRLGRPLLWQAPRLTYGLRHLLYQPCRCRPKRHGCTTHPIRCSRSELYYGHSRFG